MRLIAEQQLDPTMTNDFNGVTGDCVLKQRLEDWFQNASGWIHIIGNSLFKNGVGVAGILGSNVKGWQHIIV